MPTKSMFRPAKNTYLSRIVSLESPSAARSSVRQLKSEFSGAKTRTKKLRIARATMLAANRANASRQRESLSRKERGEFRRIYETYRPAAVGMYRRLG